MKIMHELINFRDGEYLKVKWDEFEHFTFPWHFHDEYEIIYVIESYGKKFVGDRIERFEEGDLVLLGSRLPHFWKNEHVFYQHDPAKIVKAVVLHFPSGFMDEEIKGISDLASIKKLFSLSSRGIVIEPPDNVVIGDKLVRLLKVSGMERFLLFLEILKDMANAKNTHLMATVSFEDSFSQLDMKNQRLFKVVQFIARNYTEKITLDEVAVKFGFNSSYLSRYLKKNLGKSFVSLINELRIHYACRLLIDGDLSVTQVCYECGFNNLSHFYRTFKSQVKMMPKEYQKQYFEGSKELVKNWCF